MHLNIRKTRTFRRSFLWLFVCILLLLVVPHAVVLIPGLLEGKPLVGPPNSDAIYTSGGFHCPGDGPLKIHYHLCYGNPVPLPSGKRASDYPTYSTDR